MGIARIHHPETRSGYNSNNGVVALLVLRGVDAQFLKEIIGHSFEAMVEHYCHPDDSERLKAMVTIDERLDLKQIRFDLCYLTDLLRHLIGPEEPSHQLQIVP